MRFLFTNLLLLVLPLQQSVVAQNRNNDYGVFDIPVDTRVWAALDELGVGWIREQFRLGEADLDRASILYDRIFEEGYGLLLTLHHRDASNVANQQSFINSTRGSYPPMDTIRYKQIVRSTVQHLVNLLESHGRDPSESLMIQFCNEVIPIDLVPDKPTRYWHGSSDEYLQTLALTHNAVKSLSDYDIPVVNAGFASSMLELLVDFEQGEVDDPEFAAIYQFNERVLREGKFDWVDVHLRHAKEDVKSKIDWAKQRWSGKMIATEFAGPDVRTSVVFTEAVQAQELVERMTIASEAGVDRILWSHFMENPAVEDIYFQEGLIEYQTWRKKPAYFAYKDYLEAVVTGVQNELEQLGFQLRNYPNPFMNLTTIELTLEENWSGNLEFAIFDLRGNVLSQQSLGSLGAGQYSYFLDSTGLAEGLYICRFKSGNQSITRKMILAR